jgi:uncharacterized protein
VFDKIRYLQPTTERTSDSLAQQIKLELVMATNIFVNMAVKDLQKSIAFFEKLGYKFNLQFTDETAICMIISDTIYAMLMTEPKFKSFTPKSICDTTKSQETFICLSVDNKEAVDDVIKKAVAAGGKTWKEPDDHGFMYGHEFEDLDGHVWEIMWMDPNFVHSVDSHFRLSE